jgi:protoporphyrinogen oxidase
MGQPTADFVVLGGGVAGLTIAREMVRAGRSVTVIEKSPHVGGLSRTFRRDGFSFDLGGHRFHSNNADVVRWLQELVGGDLLTVRRRSRIHIDGRFVDYPIRLGQAVGAFGLSKAAGIAASYAKVLLSGREPEARSFEEWVIRRFGRVLYEIYFKPYTEKVWGLPCDQLSADWASQRISLPSLSEAVYRALVRSKHPPATIVSHFYYPRAGYGTICDRLADEIVAGGGGVLTGTSPRRLVFHADEAVVQAGQGDGPAATLRCRHVVSTIPLDALLQIVPGDPEVEQAAGAARLAYRGVILVFIALDRPQVSADSWTYFPSPTLLFGRSHEPKNWSPALVPGPGVTSLALEVFASPGDDSWQADDRALVDRAVAELDEVGGVAAREVAGAWVLRVPDAYPVYSLGYGDRLGRLRAAMARWPRLSLVGRTGSFCYRNVDGVVEDCFRLAGALGLGARATVQPLQAEQGRWI